MTEPTARKRCSRGGCPFSYPRASSRGAPGCPAIVSITSSLSGSASMTKERGNGSANISGVIPFFGTEAVGGNSP